MAVDASAQLHRIAAALREAGDRELRLGLSRGLRAAAKPLKSAVEDAARRQLPKSGGLADRVASDRITVSVLLSARTTAVRMRTKTLETSQTDAGYVRHPVWGTWRANMPPQQIPQATGWWSKTLADSGPAVTAELVKVMDGIAAQIESA